MEAKAYNLATIFGSDRQLFAPLFQRPYVWKKDSQWEPLWSDISALAERALTQDTIKPYFMGAVVLEQISVPVGKPDARSIIDGQQRLTTLQLLLAAFRDFCEGVYPESNLRNPIEKFLSNDKDVFLDENDRHKLCPTNIDREAYTLALSCGNPEAMQRAAKSVGIKSLILDAYEYFHSAISEWVNADTEGEVEKLRALFTVIRQYIRLVAIDMDKEDDAQVIFETLNARGTPLLPTDLVKNFLFRKAVEEEDDTDDLYRSYWEEFDKDSGFWRGEIAQGRFKRARLDLFLHHYLTLTKNREVGVTNLFAEYKDMVEQEPLTSRELLKSFKLHAKYFKMFLTKDWKTPEGYFFCKLRLMDTSTVYPFLLGLYGEVGDEKEREEERLEILNVLESYLIRRTVCRLTTKGYNRLFLDLIQHLRGLGSYSAQDVSDFFIKKTKDTTRWPDDYQFLAAWLTEPIYKALKRDRLRIILRDLNAGLHTKKTEALDLPFGLTIEHFMPQHWEEHWPLANSEEEFPLDYEELVNRKGYRNRSIHTIGNLTFLTKALNPSVSNGPFQTKREQILEHSAINLNRFLMPITSWDEDAIIHRGKSLFEVAKTCWPHPGNVQVKSED